MRIAFTSIKKANSTTLTQPSKSSINARSDWSSGFALRCCLIRKCFIWAGFDSQIEQKNKKMNPLKVLLGTQDYMKKKLKKNVAQQNWFFIINNSLYSSTYYFAAPPTYLLCSSWYAQNISLEAIVGFPHVLIGPFIKNPNAQ